MADNLKLPAGAAPPPAAGSKVQPKKETVRISLPPKPASKETVRLELPPRTGGAPAAPAPAAPKPAAPVMPPPAAPRPAAPAAAAGPVAKQTVRLSLPSKPSAAKETVRLSLPPKPSAAKETVRLELPPRPGAKAPAPTGGKEIKLVVPQVDESAGSAQIPEASEASEAEMPTMDSSQAPPPAAAAPMRPPGGLKGGPPGSKPAAASAGPAPGKVVAQAPASALPDSTPSAMAMPAKKALPKPEMTSAPVAVAGAVVVRSAGWLDYTLVMLALGAGIGAVVRLLMILGGN